VEGWPRGGEGRDEVRVSACDFLSFICKLIYYLVVSSLMKD
jgi:hypothetical protein